LKTAKEIKKPNHRIQLLGYIEGIVAAEGLEDEAINNK
jgi:hypothetical protein